MGRETIHSNIQDDVLEECSNTMSGRIKATLLVTKSKCALVNSEYTLGLYGLLLPYALGFMVISILCLTMVDISLSSYLEILAESFSMTGLWAIGYFLFSILFLLYIAVHTIFKR